MKKAVVYGAVLIAIYLLVVNSTGSGVVINDSTGAATGVIKALQGR
jgi:hypothetical protein